MSEINKLAQAQNEVAIEGLFQELEIIPGVTKPDRTGKTKEFIRGTVTVAVEQRVGSETETEIIPISFFATKFKNAGGLNPAYENIMGLEKFKRSSVDGAEADYIRLSSFGNISENSFVSKTNGQLVTMWTINGSFFSKVVGTPNPRANFKTKIVIRSIEDEVDKESLPTGRLKIKGVLVQYGGRADVIDFVVEDKQAAAHIFKHFNEKDTVVVAGSVRVTVVSVTSNLSSGEAMIGSEPDFTSTSSLRRKELVITGVSPNPLDGEDAYDIDAIMEALNLRKERHDKLLADAASAPAAASPAKARGW